jgi:hypothetical protein
MELSSLLEEIPETTEADESFKLLEVALPSGFVPGFDVGYLGNTGNAKYAAGYEAYKFVGDGKEQTHVFPAAWSGITIFIGSGVKRVEFHGMTIHGGWLRAIHQGEENRPMNGLEFVPCTIVLVDCHIQADEPDTYDWVQTASDGHTSTWGVFTYNASIQAIRTSWDWKRGAEHAVYMHGLAYPGSIFEECTWVTSGGECVKLATRPGEAFWQAGGLVVSNCTFRDWGPQPWSWRGGGGVVVQGGGVNVFVLGCQFYGGPGPAKSRCVMVDDGGKDRFYSAVTGEPGVSPANGWVLLQDCLIVGDGQPSWAIVSRIGTLTQGVDVCRGLAVVGCGIYSLSETSKLELVGIQNGNILIEGCNTPLIESAANALIPTFQEAVATGPMGSVKVSKGYRGGVFEKPPVEPVG